MTARRAWALVRKEARQMLRDRSTLTLGIVLPIVLLLLFGFGLSLDVRNMPVAVVRESASPVSRDFLLALERSPYFTPLAAGSMREAGELLRTRRVDAIVRRAAHERADGAEHVQIIVGGSDANTARLMQSYLQAAAQHWMQGRQAGTSFTTPAAAAAGAQQAGRASCETRVWFNSALESRYFLVPGVTALIMTLIGSLLTALVVAREWERGTFEALAATPVRRAEILAGKTLPYFALGLAGLALCLAAAAWVFAVPMRGPLWLIVAVSALYLLVSLGIGLLISAAVKSQFLASQIVLIASFLPTVMLSGLIFDLKSAPRAAYMLAHVFPSTWYVELLQTLFLAGNVPALIVRDTLVLAAFAVLFMAFAAANIKKSLE